MSERAGTDREREQGELNPRFGKIGLSAVAAAMRYRSEQKNPVYAPVVPAAADERTEEAAA